MLISSRIRSRIIPEVIKMKNSFLFFDGTNRRKAFFLSLLSTVHKQAFAGFLFVLTSLPVFTVLSSWTALWSVSKKLICGKEVRTAKDYFSFFFGSLSGAFCSRSVLRKGLFFAENRAFNVRRSFVRFVSRSFASSFSFFPFCV